MARGYYPRFDVYSIDADGRRVPAANIELTVVNRTTDEEIGTVTADEYGVVEQGSYDAPDAVAGDVIEFEDPLTQRDGYRRIITLASSYDEAYEMRTASDRFAMETANDGAQQRSGTVSIYAQDIDDAHAEPVLLGSGRAGDVIRIPLQTALPKRYKIFPVAEVRDPRTAATEGRLRDDLAQEIYVPPSGLALLWSDGPVFREATGTLYENMIPGEALLNDGDVVKIIYQGNYDNKAGDRILSWAYDGDLCFEVTEDLPGEMWRLEVDLVRTQSTRIDVVVTKLGSVSGVNVQHVPVTVPDAAQIIPLTLDLDVATTCGVQMLSNYARRFTIAGPPPPTPPPTPFNVALSANGSTASASSAGVNAAPSIAINGVRHTNNSWSGNGYASADTMPQWFEVHFGQLRTISEIRTYSLSSTLGRDYVTEPDESDTTVYAMIDFTVEYWNGSAWANIATVTGNNKTLRVFTFPAISTEKVRVHCTAGGDNRLFMVEVEAWGY